jgi:spore protease
MMYNHDRGPLPYTDLASERRRANPDCKGVEYVKEIVGELVWERIKITSEEGERSIGRPMGIYDTLNMERADMLDGAATENSTDEISRELCYLTDVLGIEADNILVVGLGNRSLTSDSLGVLTCDKIKPTRHIKEYDRHLFSRLECSQISVISPGVMAKTGLDSVDTVAAVCERLSPDLVIAIDAIATSSYERLGSTVQITDAGICPGSGLFNVNRALNKRTLGTPVISIGVPTVIDARVLYQGGSVEENLEKSKNTAISQMFVSPKEIDEIVNHSSQIIANAINQSFGIYQ